MRRVGLLSAVILCVLSLSSMLSLAQGKGMIQGQVVNGTAGGGSTAGLDVVLRVFHVQSEGEALIATTDAQGRFRFEGLEASTDWRYLLQVSYQDVVYSEEQVFRAGEGELATEILVYETTADDEGIVVERAHILLDTSGSGLSRSTSLVVTELHVFLNPGDRTFIGGEEIRGRRATSRFLLPQDSYDLAFDDGSLGGRFLSTDKGFVDTEPQWPGTTSVMFRYVLDCGADNCNLTRDVTHPTPNLNLLVADTGVRVESTRLTLAGKVNAEAQPYLNYIGRNLMPGEQLDLHLHLPRGGLATPPKRGSSTRPWIILGGAVTALVLFYPFWRQRARASAASE